MDIKTAVPQLLTLLVIASQIAVAAYAILWIISRFTPAAKNIISILHHATQPYLRIMAFIVALTATSGSLFYSEVLKYTPCVLCWYQRIFMYPQTLLLALGIMKNDKNVADYSIGFSAVGAFIAGYHYIGQTQDNAILPCSIVGYSSSCSQHFAMEYGYVTIPLMSFTAFVLILLIMLRYKNIIRV